jgi:hypothetical protein
MRSASIHTPRSCRPKARMPRARRQRPCGDAGQQAAGVAGEVGHAGGAVVDHEAIAERPSAPARRCGCTRSRRRRRARGPPAVAPRAPGRATGRARSASRPATRRRRARCRCAGGRPAPPRASAVPPARSARPAPRPPRRAGGRGSGCCARRRRRAPTPDRRSRSRQPRLCRRSRSRRCRAARVRQHAPLHRGEERRFGVEPVEVAVEHAPRRLAFERRHAVDLVERGALPYRPPITYTVSASMSAARANTRGE